MIMITVLQSADEVLHFFNPIRPDGDTFHVAAAGSVLDVGTDGSLGVNGTSNVEVDSSVMWSDVAVLLANQAGMSVALTALTVTPVTLTGISTRIG